MNESRRIEYMPLAELIRSANIPAIAALARELLKGDTSADRVRAANSILDRALALHDGKDGDTE